MASACKELGLNLLHPTRGLDACPRLSTDLACCRRSTSSCSPPRRGRDRVGARTVDRHGARDDWPEAPHGRLRPRRAAREPAARGSDDAIGAAAFALLDARAVQLGAPVFFSRVVLRSADEPRIYGPRGGRGRSVRRRRHAARGFGRYYLVHAATYVPAATRHGRGSRARGRARRRARARARARRVGARARRPWRAAAAAAARRDRGRARRGRGRAAAGRRAACLRRAARGARDRGGEPRAPSRRARRRVPRASQKRRTRCSRSAARPAPTGEGAARPDAAAFARACARSCSRSRCRTSCSAPRLRSSGPTP